MPVPSGTPLGNDEIIGKLADGINRMNNILDLMMDVFEKGSRADTPSSLYFTREHAIPQQIAQFDTSEIKDISAMTEAELQKLSKRIERNFSETYNKLDSDIADYEAAANMASDDNVKRYLLEQKAQKEAEKAALDGQKARFDAEQHNFKDLEALTRLYASETDETAKSRIAALIEEKKAMIETSDVIREEQQKIKEEAQKTLDEIGVTAGEVERLLADTAQYEERRKGLQNASTMIARSGLGNTSLGRVAQNAIGRQQNMNALGNFGNMLNNGASGQAASIASALFGTGKAAKGATSFLKGFGGVLGKVSKFLGGPWMAVLSFILDAAKAAAKAVNEWQKLTAEFVKYQTEIEKINYEEAKQKKTLQTDIEVEKITYMGDMALKMLETQSANLLEATDIQMKAYVKSFEIGTGALTKGVNQTAYDAASAAIEQGASIQKLGVHQGLRQKQYELYGQKRGVEAESKVSSAITGMQVAEVEAMASRMEKATDLYNKELQYTANAANAATNFDIVGAGAGTAMAMRDERANTTTEEYGKGNVNAMSGEKNEIGNYKDYGVDQVTGVKTGASAQVEAALIGAGNDGDISGTLAKREAYMANHTQKIRQSVDAIKTDTELHYKKALAETQAQTALAEKQADTQAQMAEKVIDAAEAVQKNWLAVTQAVEDWQSKFEKTFNDIGQSLGMNTKGKMMQFQQSQFDIIKSVAESFGMTEEDVAAIQKGYTDNTGRNGILSKMDMRQLAALGTNMGDNGLAAQYAGEMDIFNHSVEESVDLLGDALNDVNRIGLNGRKFTKDVVNNLKLAQKYNFKGGIQGFMNMAKWAEKTRFNIASLSGMIDKVQEGGLEGVIQQSAGFQVLGGHAAMNSDPLGMMFDAWADPEAYAKRMQDMTKGFGTVDSKTGETKFNINESMQMAQIAKLQGRSVEEVRGEVMDRNKREFVKNNLTDYQKQNLTDEEKDYLGTVAKYNAKEQRYEAKVYNQKTGEVEVKDVKDLTSSDLENVMSEDHDERMETWVADIASTVKKMDAEKIWESADVASSTYQNTLNSFNERLTTMHESYLNTRQETIDNITGMQTTIEESVTGFLQQYANNVKSNTDEVSAQMENIKNSANNIAGALNGVAKTVTTAKAAVDQQISRMMSAHEASYKAANEKANASVSANTTVQAPHRQNHVQNEAYHGDTSNSAYTQNGWIFNDRNDGKWKVTAKGAEVLNKYGDFGKARQAQKNGTKINDGIVSGDGQPMAVAAKKVVPIDDGVMALSNKDDEMLAKRDGGIVDKWLNGLGSKITTLYDSMKSEFANRVSVQPDYLKMISDRWNDPAGYAKRLQDLNNGGGSVQQSGKRDVNVNINGKLTLDGGGQQIDLLQILKNNPDLVRKITEVVVNQMSSNENGGKYEMFSNRYYR